MFDLFDPSKIFIVGVVALIVIGPKELPRVMRTVGQVVGRMRRMAAEFQQQFNEAMREAELEDVKKELAAMNDAAKVDVSLDEPAKTDVAFDPARLTQHENVKAIEAEQMKAIEAPAAAAPNGAAPESVNGATAHGSGTPTSEAAAPATAGELPAPQSEVAASLRESGAP
jgi:sec-independent protein translocase protein TatB